MAFVAEVWRDAVVGEVGKHNSYIYEAGKNTSTETTNRCRRNLSQIDWPDDSRLSDTQPSNESTGIDGAQGAIISHEYRNTEDPEQTKLASGPNTADAITNKESTERWEV